jgi:Phage gp6-like head-tail connector protein
MQITLRVIEPAPDHSLLSLYDAKTALNIVQTDTTRDDQISLFIRWASSEIETYCNRFFAREKVSETFREITGRANRRIFLTHYPVEQADIESVTSSASVEYDLDSRSGTLYSVNGPWVEPVTVTYVGGYEVPVKAPLSLQQSCLLLTREAYVQAQRGVLLSGTRMIAHKESRVMFFDPLAGQGGGVSGGIGSVGSPVQRAVIDLLRHFMRFPV